MFGLRQKEDLASAELLKKMRRLYEKEAAHVPIDMHVVCTVGRPIRLTVTAPNLSPVGVTVEGEIPSPSTSKTLDKEILLRQLTKLGGTVFCAREVAVALDENIWLPISAINALRRKALCEVENMLALRPANPPQPPGATAPFLKKEPGDVMPKASEALWLRFNSHEQMPRELPAGAKIFLPCGTAPDVLHQWDAQVTVPAGVFGAHKKILQQLRAAKMAGTREAMAHTLDGVALALEAGLIPIAGEGMNLCNSASLAAMAELGVAGAVISSEITTAGFKKLHSEISVGAMVYGRLRLMLIRQDFAELDALVDRKHVKFPVRMCGDCAEVYNSRPLWLADMQNKLPKMDFALMSFTVENSETCAQAIQAWARGESYDGEFTRGWWK